MKIKSITLLFAFILTCFFVNAQNDVKAIVKIPEKVQVGGSFTVEITINKGNIGGFAKVQQTLPDGFTASPINNEGATFSPSDNKVKFLWMSLPATESFTISYKVSVGEAAIGLQQIGGLFSYIEESQTKKYSFDAQQVEVVGQVGMTATNTEVQKATSDAKESAVAADEANAKAKESVSEDEKKKAAAEIAQREAEEAAKKAAQELAAKQAADEMSQKAAQEAAMKVAADKAAQEAAQAAAAKKAADEAAQKALADKAAQEAAQAAAAKQAADEAAQKALADKAAQEAAQAAAAKQAADEAARKAQAEKVAKELAAKQAASKQTTTTTSKASVNKSTEVKKAPQGLYFHVQVASSSNKMSQEALNKKYSFANEIIIVQESGLYKYAAGKYNSYNEAKASISKYGIDGAFVIAIKDGVKISLKEAVEMTR